MMLSTAVETIQSRNAMCFWVCALSSYCPRGRENNMTPQQLVGLAARLFAIWLCVTAVQAVGIGQAMMAQDRSGAFPLPYVFAGLYLAAGIVLWIFPLWIAHRLIPRTKFEDQLRLPVRDAVMVGCVILGLGLLVVRAIPALSWYISIAAFWLANGQPLTTMEPARHLELVNGLVNLVVGWLLIAKYDRIGQLILPGSEQDQPDRSAP